MSSTVCAVELGLRLRSRREQLGLTATAVGKQTGIGGSNLSSIEIAKRKLTSTKLDELAAVYEISADELAELEALRGKAHQHEWWDDYARLYSEELLRYFGLEAGADRLCEYAAETIPGLLQTGDYARAMIRGGSVYIKPVDVGPRVESRLARQARLDGPDPVKFTAIIGQTALRQLVGDRAIMRHQLDHLVEAIESKDNVDIHVMPYTAGAHPIIGGGFSILGFASPWIGDMVWQDAVTTGNLIDKKHIVQELTASFEHALDLALDREHSLAMIQQVRHEMES